MEGNGRGTLAEWKEMEGNGRGTLAEWKGHTVCRPAVGFVGYRFVMDFQLCLEFRLVFTQRSRLRIGHGMAISRLRIGHGMVIKPPAFRA